MINSKKKGFTIVELVIVIAVVAILAAVLIPTFSNLVKKANLSNDQSMVRNMNTTLALESVLEDGFENAGEAIDALNRNGFSGKYNTFSSKFHYCYSLENNKMYLVNDKNEVIYPESIDNLSSLWGLYTDNKTSKVNGITKYVAMTNIANTDHYEEAFETGSYTIDLNGYFIAVSSALTNVTATNGIVISGAQKGEGASSDYELVEDSSEIISDEIVNLGTTNGNVITIKNKIFRNFVHPTITNKSVVFENCIFYGESVQFNDASGADEGVYGELKNCQFVDTNEENWSILSHISLNVINCTFTNLNIRGAIQVQQNSKNMVINITGCTFTGTAGNYPLIRFVGPHGTNVGNISSLKIENCEFTTLNKGTGILGFSGTGSSLYNYIGSVDGPTVTFTNNKVGDDITSDKYVVDAGTNNKLADLFAKSVK